jgi:hypothetical protein
MWGLRDALGQLLKNISQVASHSTYPVNVKLKCWLGTLMRIPVWLSEGSLDQHISQFA